MQMPLNGGRAYFAIVYNFVLEQKEVTQVVSLSQKRSIRSKKCIFWMFLTVFLPFYANRANRSCRSLLSCSFLKINRIDSLLLLFTKGQKLGNCSRHYLQKSDHE